MSPTRPRRSRHPAGSRDRPAPPSRRADPVDRLERGDLRRREARVGVAVLALDGRGLEPAAPRVGEDAVLHAVERVARRVHGGGDRGDLLRRDEARRIERERARVEDGRREQRRPVVGRGAGEDAVVVAGIALRLHQRLAAAVGAAVEVRLLSRAVRRRRAPPPSRRASSRGCRDGRSRSPSPGARAPTWRRSASPCAPHRSPWPRSLFVSAIDRFMKSMSPANPPLPRPSRRPFHASAGSQTSISMLRVRRRRRHRRHAAERRQRLVERADVCLGERRRRPLEGAGRDNACLDRRLWQCERAHPRARSRRVVGGRRGVRAEDDDRDRERERKLHARSVDQAEPPRAKDARADAIEICGPVGRPDEDASRGLTAH